MTETWNWRGAARCRVADADELFVRGRHQREARRFCGTCPVRTECLAYALDHRVEVGVWGGMTERQRRALLRCRPQVRSWARLLADAQRAHYTAGTDTAGAESAAHEGGAVCTGASLPGVSGVTGDDDTAGTRHGGSVRTGRVGDDAATGTDPTGDVAEHPLGETSTRTHPHRCRSVRGRTGRSGGRVGGR